MGTKIEWSDETWNPVTGCTKVSPGCDNCYAERVTERFGGDFSKVILHHDRLDKPFHWRKPRKVFVNSMSDLFHEEVPTAFIDTVFKTMANTPQHIYQILTKRAPRMKRYMLTHWFPGGVSNVWLGVSVESWTQSGRLYHLKETPAAKRFISCEPLIGPMGGIKARDLKDIDWVIVGGESGYGDGIREMKVEWAREIRDACKEAGVAFFMKQMGRRYMDMGFNRKYSAKGSDIRDIPEDLQIREYPDDS